MHTEVGNCASACWPRTLKTLQWQRVDHVQVDWQAGPGEKIAGRFQLFRNEKRMLDSVRLALDACMLDS